MGSVVKGRGIQADNAHRLGGKLSGKGCLIGLAGGARLQDAASAGRLECDHFQKRCTVHPNIDPWDEGNHPAHCAGIVTFLSHGLSGSLPQPQDQLDWASFHQNLTP